MRFEYYNLEAVRLPQLLDLARSHLSTAVLIYEGQGQKSYHVNRPFPSYLLFLNEANLKPLIENEPVHTLSFLHNIHFL